MATNITILRPQTTTNNRPRRTAGLLATAALGLALLAGGVIGQARPTMPPAEGIANNTYVPSMWDTREDRRVDLLPAPFVADQFTYREDHRQAASSALATSNYVADLFTYREDHRAELVAPFVPDQFTSREDRRTYP